MDFYEIVLSRKEEILEKTKELLRIPSVLDKFNLLHTLVMALL